MKTTTALGRALLLTLGLTACSATTNPTAAAPVGAGTPTASAIRAPSTVATTALPTGATKGVQVTLPHNVGRPGRCGSWVLRVRLGQSQGAAGHSYVALLFTNRSRVTCTLTGYPGVSFTTGPYAHQLASPAGRDYRFPVARVSLAPAATVHATIEIANYANYDARTCRPARATGFRIYPPGSTGSLLVSAPQTACSRPGIQGFHTSVVRPGTSPD